MNKFPSSKNLLDKSRLPLGILIHPYKDLSVSMHNFDLKLKRNFNVIFLHTIIIILAINCYTM